MDTSFKSENHQINEYYLLFYDIDWINHEILDNLYYRNENNKLIVTCYSSEPNLLIFTDAKNNKHFVKIDLENSSLDEIYGGYKRGVIDSIHISDGIYEYTFILYRF